MNAFAKAIRDLEGQQQRIEAAIRVLRGIEGGRGASRSGARNMSPEGRARIAAAQSKRWAKIKSAAKAPARRTAAIRAAAAAAGSEQ